MKRIALIAPPAGAAAVLVAALIVCWCLTRLTAGWPIAAQAACVVAFTAAVAVWQWQRERHVAAMARTIADTANEAILCLGADGRCHAASPAFATMTGWTGTAAARLDIEAFIHPDDREAVATVIPRLRAGEPQVRLTYRYRRNPSGFIWVEGVFQHAEPSHAWPGGYRASIIDATDRMRLERQADEIRAEAATMPGRDGLTLLSNRLGFDNALAAEWARGSREETPIAILMIEIDAFDAYTAKHGPQAADELLRIIAACVYCGPGRITDITARYTATQFAVLLPNTDGFGALTIAREIGDHITTRALSFSEPATRGPASGSSASDLVSACIGVAAQVPAHATPPGHLVAHAMQALAEARLRGPGTIEADTIVQNAAGLASRWPGSPPEKPGENAGDD